MHFLMFFFAVKEDTLVDLVSAMSEDVGLVQQMPYVCDKEGFSSILEKVSVVFSGLMHVQNYV